MTDMISSGFKLGRKQARGMAMQRVFTKEGVHPYDDVKSIGRPVKLFLNKKVRNFQTSGLLMLQPLLPLNTFVVQ
jgi:hypothetical protein